MIKGTVDCLKSIADKKSPSYLTEEPYEVYKELVSKKAADRKTAAAILYLLAHEVMEHIDPCCNPEQISASIKSECGLNKRMSDRLALILTSLYSGANRKEWKDKNLEGLRQFLNEELNYTWKGFAVWDAGNGTVDCHYEAEIILSPTDAVQADKELSRRLDKNPFISKEEIGNLFTKRIKEYLDNEFEEYCTEDDYYQPVVEDYGSNLEYDLSKWCKENGFELVSCEGDGYDGGYEPKYRREWY